MVLQDEDDDDYEDEVRDLKERLAAYNLESSPDHSEGKYCTCVVLVYTVCGSQKFGI